MMLIKGEGITFGEHEWKWISKFLRFAVIISCASSEIGVNFVKGISGSWLLSRLVGPYWEVV